MKETLSVLLIRAAGFSFVQLSPVVSESVSRT